MRADVLKGVHSPLQTLQRVHEGLPDELGESPDDYFCRTGEIIFPDELCRPEHERKVVLQNLVLKNFPQLHAQQAYDDDSQDQDYEELNYSAVLRHWFNYNSRAVDKQFDIKAILRQA